MRQVFRKEDVVPDKTWMLCPNPNWAGIFTKDTSGYMAYQIFNATNLEHKSNFSITVADAGDWDHYAYDLPKIPDEVLDLLNASETRDEFIFLFKLTLI